MKCFACGFDEEAEKLKIIDVWERHKEFLEIEGDFVSSFHRVKLNIFLYACPDCGTIKINKP